VSGVIIWACQLAIVALSVFGFGDRVGSAQ